MNQIIENDLAYIFKRSGHFAGELNNKTILLTGGTGFIGKWLLEYFRYLNESFKFNINLFILSRNPEFFLNEYPKFRTGYLTFIRGDIVDFDFDMFPVCDMIIHAAADADAKLNLGDPLKMISSVVDGTKRVLDFAVKVKSAKVLYLSSGAVYGVQPDYLTGFPEDFTGGPDILSASSAYSEAKRMAELLCICYQKQYNLNISIARCFAFVGPYLPLDKHFAIGNFIGNGLRGEDIVVKGNGLPLRSYMYSADLVVWLLYILVYGSKAAAYNVGSDIAVSIRDLAYKVASFFPGLSVKILGQVNATDRNQNYIPCIEKARNELKLPSLLIPEEAILRTILYYNEQR